MKKSIIIILSIIVLILLTSCDKKDDLIEERDLQLQAELRHMEIEKIFNCTLNEDNYFDVHPSPSYAIKGKTLTIIYGIHNYGQENWTGISEVKCNLKRVMYSRNIFVLPESTEFYAIIIETKEENTGTYECELWVNEDHKNFSVNIIE